MAEKFGNLATKFEKVGDLTPEDHVYLGSFLVRPPHPILGRITVVISFAVVMVFSLRKPLRNSLQAMWNINFL